MEDRLATAIAASNHISHVLCMAKGLGGKLGEEDRKLDIGGHVLHINRHSVEVVSHGILKNGHQSSGFGEERLDTCRGERELHDQGWIDRSEHLDRRSNLTWTAEGRCPKRRRIRWEPVTATRRPGHVCVL